MSDNAPTQNNAPTQPDTKGADPRAQAPTKKNSKGNQSFRKQNRGASSFKGSVEKMNGHVFRAHAEQSKRGEFQRTLEELKVYCSTTYIQEAGLKLF